MKYDNKSPLDDNPNPQAERLVAKRPRKDKVLTIRLDSQSRTQLDDIARRCRMGSSTLARIILVHQISLRMKRVERKRKSEAAGQRGKKYDDAMKQIKEEHGERT